MSKQLFKNARVVIQTKDGKWQEISSAGVVTLSQSDEIKEDPPKGNFSLSCSCVVQKSRQLRAWLKRNVYSNRAYENGLAFHYGVVQPWRIRRYYLGYASHKPPYRVKEPNRHPYQPIQVKERERRYIQYLMRRGPVADFFRNMPKTKGGRHGS